MTTLTEPKKDIKLAMVNLFIKFMEDKGVLQSVFDDHIKCRLKDGGFVFSEGVECFRLDMYHAPIKKFVSCLFKNKTPEKFVGLEKSWLESYESLNADSVSQEYWEQMTLKNIIPPISPCATDIKKAELYKLILELGPKGVFIKALIEEIEEDSLVTSLASGTTLNTYNLFDEYDSALKREKEHLKDNRDSYLPDWNKFVVSTENRIKQVDHFNEHGYVYSAKV
jgi:hypothetical protein